MQKLNLTASAMLLTTLIFGGCDSGDATPEPSSGSASSSALVPDYQLETLQKAKQVGALAQKQDQKVRDAVQ